MKPLVLVSILILVFGAVSERLKRSPLTPPMVFVAVGLAAGAGLLGSFGEYDGFELTRVLAELTLILVLFTDASRILVKDLRQSYHLPLRLLAIGMPLSVALGAALSLVSFPQLSLGAALVLAAILVPTDAALGQSVVSSPSVPARIRQALNVESGLNDGLALPFVVVFAAIATMADDSPTSLVGFALAQVTLGPLAGAAVGYLGGRAVTHSVERKWMDHSFEQLSALALAFLSFLVAEMIGGNGFIAAFVSGMTLGNTAPRIGPVLQEFAETEGQLLSLVTFLCVGAHLAWPMLGEPTVAMWLYAIASLTVVRMLPVAISLIGTKLRPMSFVFLGWFGPRGLASVLFAFLVLEQDVPGHETILQVVVLTVILSVFAHGATAWPSSKVYARKCDAERARAPEEWVEVPELSPRISYRG